MTSVFPQRDGKKCAYGYVIYLINFILHVPYVSEREDKGCVFQRPAACAVHATLPFSF